MKNNIPKISYDSESEVLSIEVRKGKDVDSDVQGNLVLDYDSKGRVVRVNLYQIDFDAFHKHKNDIKHFTQSASAHVAFQ